MCVLVDDHLDSKSAFGSHVSLVSSTSISNAPDVLVDVIDAIENDAEAGKHGDSLATGTADQFIKDAIPYLPLSAAFLLCFINCIIPGLGK